MEILKNFGKRVIEIRKTKGLSQEQLAKKASLNCNYLEDIESGEVNSSLENIQNIAQGLDVEIYPLFDF